MTHGIGIPVSKDLDVAFSNARTDGGIRYLIVQIKDEQLIEIGRQPLSDSFEQDYKTIHDHLKPKIPSYFILRLDSKNLSGFEWFLIAYVPDGSHVKERMLYASTRESFKRQLGLSYFNGELYASIPEELSYEAFKSNQEKGKIESPLTEKEIQLKLSINAVVDPGVSKEYVHSVKFPLSTEAQDKIKALKSNSINFVQMYVDVAKETVELASAKNTTLETIKSELPVDEPRFTLFNYQHTFENTPYNQTVFIYYCPDSAKVKLKMLYSTVKAVVTGAAEDLGLKIEKKVEITEPTEITEKQLNSELHQAGPTANTRIEKPRPTGKPRLIKK